MKHSPHSRTSILALPAVLSLLGSGPVPTVRAGDDFAKMPVAVTGEVEMVKEPDSEFAFIMPGWLMGLEGTTGVGGIETSLDIGIDDIFKNLNMIALGRLEGRHDKLGFILEGIYADMSVGGTSPGPLLSTVSVGTEMLLAEGVLTYRFLENDKAWVEFLAGARYMYLGLDLTLEPKASAVEDTSEELSAAILGRTVEVVQAEIDARLPGILAGLQDQSEDLRDAAISEIQERVEGQVTAIKGALGDRIDEGIGSSLPGIGDGIIGSDRVCNAIRDYVNAQVASDIEAARASASAAVGQARARVQREVRRQLERAERQLARTIEREINTRVPSSPVSASKAWVDPFVGFRGRCDLTDQWYLVGRGDIGGFGVSSEITWSAFAALGLDVSDRVAMEAGYRYMYMDYQSGAFTWDMVFKGPFLGMRVEF